VGVARAFTSLNDSGLFIFRLSAPAIRWRDFDSLEQYIRLRPLWWQLPERFRGLAVYEVRLKCPENISHFTIVRL
jgi:hypothetical protein